MKGKASTLSLYVEGNDDVTRAHVVLSPRHIKMSLGGRFGGGFSPKFFFGRDCDDILRDDQADPLEKDMCETFKHFSQLFGEDDSCGDDFFQLKDSDRERETESASGSDPDSLRGELFRRPQRSPPAERRSPFGDVPYSHSSTQIGEDRNLDDQISRDPKALERYLQTSPPNQHQGFPHFDSRHSHSESVVRKQFPDGSVEERRIIRRSDGTTEETVTRRSRDGQVTEEQSQCEELDGREVLDFVMSWIWPWR